MKNEVLIETRLKEGLSQREVAEQAHIPKVSYQRYEMGLREPKVKVANRISTVLHSDSLTLFGI